MMYNMMINNMANMMAEDSGLFELRSPKVSGMRAKGSSACCGARRRSLWRRSACCGLPEDFRRFERD